MHDALVIIVDVGIYLSKMKISICLHIGLPIIIMVGVIYGSEDMMSWGAACHHPVTQHWSNSGLD